MLINTFTDTKKEACLGLFCLKAESEGFEPPVPQAVQQISSLPRSTTPPTLQKRGKCTVFL